MSERAFTAATVEGGMIRLVTLARFSCGGCRVSCFLSLDVYALTWQMFLFNSVFRKPSK